MTSLFSSIVLSAFNGVGCKGLSDSSLVLGDDCINGKDDTNATVFWFETWSIENSWKDCIGWENKIGEIIDYSESSLIWIDNSLER